MAVKVNLHEIKNAGPKQTKLIERATTRLQDAVNHPAFSDLVLNANYRERRWRSTDRRVVIVPPEDILARIRVGRERATPVDYEIDLRIHLKKKRRGVRGSTTLGSLPIRTAYWFMQECLNNDDPATLAGHFMHEWMHVSGFFHYPNNSARKDVPYRLGQIVHSILIEHFDEKDVPEDAKFLDEDDCGCLDEQKMQDEPDEDPDAFGEMM